MDKGSTSKAETLFCNYLQRELNYAVRRFGFDISLKWRAQLLENKDKIIDAIEKNLNRGVYNGYYRYKNR